jgi:hypothetical protein
MRDDLGKTLENVIHGPEEREILEATRPQPESLDPGDPLCLPVMVERRRRKLVDNETDLRLLRIEVLVARTAKTTRLTLVALTTMVVCAALEYAGVIGRDTPPIWASAVVDGVRYALGVGQ